MLFDLPEDKIYMTKTPEFLFQMVEYIGKGIDASCHNFLIFFPTMFPKVLCNPILIHIIYITQLALSLKPKINPYQALFDLFMITRTEFDWLNGIG